MKTGSGFAASYSYEDHRNVKTAVSNSFGLTAVSTYTYEYDELGRRKSVKNTGSAFNNPNFNIYGYNDRSEVTASNSFTGEDLANKNNPISDRSCAYNYDPIGNRKTVAEAANNLTYTANSLNQYESISGGANPETPAYDADGNMTVAKGMIYAYNAENRLIEAAPQNPQQGSVKSTYLYDYLGRRARKTLYTYSSGSWQKQKDISFIYDGWNMVKESEKTSDSSPEVPVYYVWGLDLSQSMQGAGGVGGLIASVKSGNEYLYTYDANGNAGQMVKASDGVIAARYEYDPFGKTIFSEGPMAAENPYRFSTKYLDGETGFYYYGFRYYDVEIGRWINRDPVGEGGGPLIYGFVSNNAVRYIDILGLSDIDTEFGAALSFEVGYDTYTKQPTYSLSISGSAAQSMCDNLKFKADVNYRLYSGGLGTSVYGRSVNSDMTVSLYATIGNGEGDATPTYTLNYNTKSVLKDTYQNSFSWGQAWNYNSAVGQTRDGFLGLKANDFYLHYNNDDKSPPSLGGGTDYGWTAGLFVGLYVGGGKNVEMGFQDFTGRYIRRDKTHLVKGVDHYDQYKDQRGLNRADWFFRYGGNFNSVTASVASPGFLNGQHLVHDNVLGNLPGKLPHFEYLEEDNYFSTRFSVMGEVSAQGGLK